MHRWRMNLGLKVARVWVFHVADYVGFGCLLILVVLDGAYLGRCGMRFQAEI